MDHVQFGHFPISSVTCPFCSLLRFFSRAFTPFPCFGLVLTFHCPFFVFSDFLFFEAGLALPVQRFGALFPTHLSVGDPPHLVETFDGSQGLVEFIPPSPLVGVSFASPACSRILTDEFHSSLFSCVFSPLPPRLPSVPPAGQGPRRLFFVHCSPATQLSCFW